MADSLRQRIFCKENYERVTYLHSESRTFPTSKTFQMHHKFSPRNKIETLPKESRSVLALETLKKDSKLSLRKAATIYEVPETSLRDRRAGKQPRSELPANSRKLTT